MKAQNKKTIFADNKSFSDVIVEGVIFSLGTTTALTIIAAIITAAQNLIY